MLSWSRRCVRGALRGRRTSRVAKHEKGHLWRPFYIFVLPVPAPRAEAIKSIFDLPERVRAELEQFFLSAVAFEGKAVRLLGFDGPVEADRCLRNALVE